MTQKKKQPERLVQTEIIHWLQIKQKQGMPIMFWRQPTVGTYFAKKGTFIKPQGAGTRTGVADILGIYNGVPLAIEVKSKTGKLSKNQEQFLKEFADNGGIAIVARSIEDVEKGLKNYEF